MRPKFKKALSAPSGVASNKSRRSSKIFKSNDAASACSSTVDKEGVLIFPSVQRLTVSSQSAPILGGIAGLRRSSSAPYQSRKELKNLPPTLKNCRKSSSRHHTNINHSAWELRQPASTSGRGNAAYSRSKTGVAKKSQYSTEIRDLSEMDIKRKSSSDVLPVSVSPAYKFVPIGREQDHDDCSFHPEDYDICKEATSEEQCIDAVAYCSSRDVDNDAIVQLLADKITSVVDAEIRDATQMDYRPPSASTTGNSSQYIDFARENGSSKRERGLCDKYSMSLEDDEEESWLPTIKQEMMKISSLLTLNCGASNLCEDIYESAQTGADKDVTFSNDLMHSMSDSCEDSEKGGARHRDQPPSPVSTIGTSHESIEYLKQERGSPKPKPDRRFNIDKYCVSVGCESDDDWFGVKRVLCQ